MSRDVIVTCAVTGGHQNHGKHPDYPITPQQIAAACLEARHAGAAIVHIHVRDPATGMPTAASCWATAANRSIGQRLNGAKALVPG